MRIRRSATRLLGSAYSTTSAAPPLDVAPLTELLPPPPPHLVPCSATKSHGGGSSSRLDAASGECCELNHSAWDLIADLSLSDTRVEDDILDKYFVHVTTRASWLFSPTLPPISAKKKKKKQATASTCRVQLQSKFEKKAIMNSKVKKNQKSDHAKNAKVRQEEHEEGAAEVWNCKKNDGKGWQCHRKVSHSNSLCNYHFMKKRSTDSKAKPQKMKSSNDFNVTEGFYYYAGFGFRSKRQCRSSVDDYVAIKELEEEDSIKEEEEEEHGRDALHLNQTKVEGDDDDTNRTVAFGDDIMGIADIDEDSCDDDYNRIGTTGSSMAGNGDPQASNGGSKRKIRRKKQRRKPVKAPVTHVLDVNT